MFYVSEGKVSDRREDKLMYPWWWRRKLYLINDCNPCPYLQIASNILFSNSRIKVDDQHRQFQERWILQYFLLSWVEMQSAV